MRKTIIALIIAILILSLTAGALRRDLIDLDFPRAQHTTQNAQANAAVPKTVTPVEAPQFIEFSNGDGAVCVNCPKVSDLAGGYKVISCTNTERNCEIYFGFLSTKEPQTYQQDGKSFVYKLSNKDEFSQAEDNFVVKLVTSKENPEIVGSGIAEEKYLPVSGEFIGGIDFLKDLIGKTLYVDDKQTKTYKLNNDLVEYVVAKDSVITLKDGKIEEIRGASKTAQDQRMITVEPTMIDLTVPLKFTEKLTFQGLYAKENYDLSTPVLEIENPNKNSQDIKSWVSLIDNRYIAKDGTWWLQLCGDSIPFYAPGSKFQLMQTGQESEANCKIDKYILTTAQSDKLNIVGPYKCGEISYSALSGKLQDLYCDQAKSTIDCRGDKNCETSELRFVADATGNEISLGTNDFIADSKFEYVKKAELPALYEFKAGEIRLGQDYILPTEEASKVIPIQEGVFDQKGTSAIEASTGTNIMRAWTSGSIVHDLDTTTDNQKTSYRIGIYPDSNKLAARIGVIYPSDFFTHATITADEHKEVRAGIDLVKDNEFKIPTLGIKVDYKTSLGTVDISYRAMTADELKKRALSNTDTAYSAEKIPVKEGDDLYDVLARYCVGMSYKDPKKLTDAQAITRMEAVDRIAEEIEVDANKNLNSPNAEYLDKTFYRTVTKDGDITLPQGKLTFTDNDPKRGQFLVNVVPPRCGIMAGKGNASGYSVERKIEDIKQESAGNLQTCTGNCYTVKAGDSLSKIYKSICDQKKVFPFLWFKGWVLGIDQFEGHNPIVHARENTWADKIWPGDVISVPDGCDGNKLGLTIGTVSGIGVEIGPVEIVEKTACPKSDDDCGSAIQLAPYTFTKDGCDAYANTLTHCPNRCMWVERDMENGGACILSENKQFTKAQAASDKLKAKGTQGRLVPKPIQMVVEGLTVDLTGPNPVVVSPAQPIPPTEIYSPNQKVKLHSIGMGPGTTPGKLQAGQEPAFGSKDVPTPVVTLSPSGASDQTRDFTIDRAYIPAEWLECNYQTEGVTGILRITNKEDLELSKTLPPNVQSKLKNTFAAPAQAAVESYYKTNAIPSICLSLAAGGSIVASPSWQFVQ